MRRLWGRGWDEYWWSGGGGLAKVGRERRPRLLSAMGDGGKLCCVAEFITIIIVFSTT